MSTSADRRVRRAKDKEAVITQLTDDGVFATLRDALVFAAALGYDRNTSRPIAASDEPVRWDTMVKNPYFEAIVDMICAADPEIRPEQLGDQFLDDRLSVFEEFANGGLEILERELRAGYGNPVDIINGLIAKAFSSNADADDLGLKGLADELVW